MMMKTMMMLMMTPIYTLVHLRNMCIFTQAYYYEKMEECPANTMPDFTATLTDLLPRINLAKAEVDSVDRPSKAVIDVEIVVSYRKCGVGQS